MMDHLITAKFSIYPDSAVVMSTYVNMSTYDDMTVINGITPKRITQLIWSAMEMSSTKRVQTDIMLVYPCMSIWTKSLIRHFNEAYYVWALLVWPVLRTRSSSQAHNL